MLPRNRQKPPRLGHSRIRHHDHTTPIINGSSQAIWQAKIPPHIQGRVFATRALLARIAAPLGMALTGPLADTIFEPAMTTGGSLAPTFGWLVGTGPGAGMALIFVLMGLIGTLPCIAGYAFNAVRNIEDILPDHDETITPTQTTTPDPEE